LALKKKIRVRAQMGGWWPFGGKKEAPDMKAASRVQCYDNRDAYFFCLGARARPPSPRAAEAAPRSACRHAAAAAR
jgi:hypothetical protein